MNLTSLNLSQPLMGNPGTPGIPPNTTITSEWVDVSSLYSLIATISQTNTGGTLYIDQSNNKSTYTSTSVAYVSVEQLVTSVTAQYARIKVITGSGYTTSGFTTLGGTKATETPIVDVGGEVYNVKAFGAKGDGVTDDGPTLAFVLSTVSSTGGIVFLPPGIYLTGQLINLPSNVVIRGSGINNTILKLKDSVNPTDSLGIIQPSGYGGLVPTTGWFIENSGVEDLSIDGNFAGNAAGVYECLTLSLTKNCHAYRVEVYDSAEVGIQALAPVTGTDPTGIPVVAHCIAHDCNIDGFQFGIIIADNLYSYSNSQNGIHITANYSGTTAAEMLGMVALLSNSKAEKNSKVGISTDVQIGPSFPVTITNCTSSLNGEFGFFCELPGVLASVSALGNGADGLFIGVDDLIVDDFLSKNNGQGSVVSQNQYSGVNINGARNHIQLKGVRAYDDQSSQTQLYGVAFYSYSTGTTRNQISESDLTGNKTSAFSDTSLPDWTIRAILGYNPTGPQTAPAIPASGTALANPFPFDCTVYVTGGAVTAIAVGGTATGLTSGSVFIPAGETITLTYTSAPTWVWIGD